MQIEITLHNSRGTTPVDTIRCNNQFIFKLQDNEEIKDNAVTNISFGGSYSHLQKYMFLEVDDETRERQTNWRVPENAPVAMPQNFSSTGNLASVFRENIPFKIALKKVNRFNFTDEDNLHGLVGQVTRARHWYTNETEEILTRANEMEFTDETVQAHWESLIARIYQLDPDGRRMIDIWKCTPQRRRTIGTYYAVGYKDYIPAGGINYLQQSMYLNTETFKQEVGFTHIELELFLLCLMLPSEEERQNAKKAFVRYAKLMELVSESLVTLHAGNPDLTLTDSNYHNQLTLVIENGQLTELFRPVILKSEGERIIEETIETIAVRHNTASPEQLSQLDRHLSNIGKQTQIEEYKALAKQVNDTAKAKTNMQKRMIDLHFKEEELRNRLQLSYLNLTRSKADTQKILTDAGIKPENIITINGEQYFKLQAPATLTGVDRFSRTQYPLTAQWVDWIKDNKPLRPWFEAIFKVSEFFDTRSDNLSVSRPSKEMLKNYTFSPSPHYYFANCDGGAWVKIFALLAKGAFGPAVLMLKANLGSFNLLDSFIAGAFERVLRVSQLPAAERPRDHADTNLANFWTSSCKISGDEGHTHKAWPLGLRIAASNQIIDDEINTERTQAQEAQRRRAIELTQQLAQNLANGMR